MSGTVDDQYQEWRRILGEMFRLEEGSVSQDDADAVSNIEAQETQFPDSGFETLSETDL